MSALLEKVNVHGSALAEAAAAPNGPLYLGPRGAGPITCVATPAGVLVTTPTCIEPCNIENSIKDIEDNGDIMSS